MAELTITYKIVCDSCKQGLDFEINFPDTMNGMEELSIKPCECQNQNAIVLNKAIADIKQAMKFIK